MLPVSKPMTLAQFLAWEERQELRFEFDGVRPIERLSGTVAHAHIQTNLAVAIGGRLRASSCQFYRSSLKIQVAGDHIRYPDAFVTCAPGKNDSTVVSEPVIIFEIISPDTTRVDRYAKALEYQATPSVRRYVILEQDSINATVYVRSGNAWTHEILIADSILALPEIGVELPLAELYDGIVFETKQDADRTPTASPPDRDFSDARRQAGRGQEPAAFDP